MSQFLWFRNVVVTWVGGCVVPARGLLGDSSQNVSRDSGHLEAHCDWQSHFQAHRPQFLIMWTSMKPFECLHNVAAGFSQSAGLQGKGRRKLSLFYAPPLPPAHVMLHRFYNFPFIGSKSRKSSPNLSGGA